MTNLPDIYSKKPPRGDTNKHGNSAATVASQQQQNNHNNNHSSHNHNNHNNTNNSNNLSSNFVKPVISRNASHVSKFRSYSRVYYSSIEPTLDPDEFDHSASVAPASTHASPEKTHHHHPSHHHHHHHHHHNHRSPHQQQQQHTSKYRTNSSSVDSFFLPQLAVPSFMQQEKKNQSNEESNESNDKELDTDDENNVWHSPRVKREKSMFLVCFLRVYWVTSNHKSYASETTFILSIFRTIAFTAHDTTFVYNFQVEPTNTRLQRGFNVAKVLQSKSRLVHESVARKVLSNAEHSLRRSRFGHFLLPRVETPVYAKKQSSYPNITVSTAAAAAGRQQLLRSYALGAGTMRSFAKSTMEKKQIQAEKRLQAIDERVDHVINSSNTGNDQPVKPVETEADRNIVNIPVTSWSDLMNIAKIKGAMQWDNIIQQRDSDKTTVMLKKGELVPITSIAMMQASEWGNGRCIQNAPDIWKHVKEIYDKKMGIYHSKQKFFEDVKQMLNRVQRTPFTVDVCERIKTYFLKDYALERRLVFQLVYDLGYQKFATDVGAQVVLQHLMSEAGMQNAEMEDFKARIAKGNGVALQKFLLAHGVKQAEQVK